MTAPDRNILAATFGQATPFVDSDCLLGAVLCLHFRGSEEGEEYLNAVFADTEIKAAAGGFGREVRQIQGGRWERVMSGWIAAKERFGEAGLAQ